MKILRFLLLSVLLAALLVVLGKKQGKIPPLGSFLNPFTGVWQNAEPADAIPWADVSLPGVSAPVTIAVDSNWVPDIYAENLTDLFYAQGYMEASLRLWQMDFSVRAAEGRISEILGDVMPEQTLKFDRMQRRLGMPYGAFQKLEAIHQDEEANRILTAYSNGINAYINQLKPADYPLEYKLFDYEPEGWSVYKTALFLMAMSKDLTNREYDIESTRFIERFGASLFSKLYPEFFPSVEPVIPSDGNWGFDFFEEEKELDTVMAHLPNGTEAKPDMNIGSNNWALSGSKTASGYPLLANDPHLRLSFPAIWMQMHLHAPGYNVGGATFPGTPGIIIGCNDSIAWGVTNAGRDVKDWYTITFEDNSRKRYQWGDGFRETSMTIEEIKIRGSEPFIDTLLFTHFGPITYDRNFEQPEGADALALRWRAHDAGMEFRTFYELNTASNVSDYLNALQHYACPAQNFAFASVNGDIALRQQGKFATLDKGQGRIIQDGSKPSMEWGAPIPFQEIPMQINPERGFVSSANQHAVDTSYPYYTHGQYEYYRNRRINSELTKLQGATVEDMIDLQYDNYDLQAAETLPLLLDYLDESLLDSTGKRFVNLLSNWDFFSDSTSKAASIYEIFFRRYETFLWDELLATDYGLNLPEEYTTYVLLRDSIDHPFIDYAQTETESEEQADIVQLAFAATVDTLRDAKTLAWGQFKGTTVEHLAKIEAFSQQLVVGGNRSIANATSKHHGPSWRMIVDFAGGKVQGMGVYPGGQSGNPGSHQYNRFIEDWKNRRYYPIRLTKTPPTNSDNTFTFQIKPAP